MEETRKIDRWNVVQAIQLGDREVAFCVDRTAEWPYLVTDVTINACFGTEQYVNTVGDDDYLEAMELFLERVQGQLEQIKAQRLERQGQGVDMTPLGEEHCIPGSEGQDYTGRVVIVRSETLRSEYATPDYQLCLVTGGNGCRPDSYGQAVFAVQLFDKEHTRWNRADILGIADETKLPRWAVDRLAELREKAQEKRAGPRKKQVDHDEIYR